MKTYFTHIPVLLNETIELLNLKDNGIVVDCTLGLGGHAKEILKKSGANGKLIGIDRDEEALLIAKENLKDFAGRFTAVKGNFLNIISILNGLNIQKVDGILFDLGLSSMQIDASQRGFSLRADGPLDMRMDRSQKLNATDIINQFSPEDLEKTIRDYGEEKLYKRIVKGIVAQRKIGKIDTTLKLIQAIKRSIPRMNPKFETAVITRVFQAIRVKVNNELDNLRSALKDSIDMLTNGSRIVVISYHSLEDRIVKETFRAESKECLCPPRQLKCTCNHKKKLVIITKKPIVPSNEEIKENPRSRSAKLRAAEKI